MHDFDVTWSLAVQHMAAKRAADAEPSGCGQRQQRAVLTTVQAPLNRRCCTVSEVRKEPDSDIVI
ncbi:MAG: hypothetical protein AAFU78_20145 [Cyanobacteria bacterium J06633_2]